MSVLSFDDQPEHVKRVLEERKELDEKIVKLTQFLYNGGQNARIYALQDKAKEDLRDQLAIMKRYSDVLSDRLAYL